MEEAGPDIEGRGRGLDGDVFEESNCCAGFLETNKLGFAGKGVDAEGEFGGFQAEEAAETAVYIEIAGEAHAGSDVAGGALEKETRAAKLFLDHSFRHARVIGRGDFGVPADGRGMAGVVDNGRDGMLIEAVEADDADGVIDRAIRVAADDDAAIGQLLAAVHIDVTCTGGGAYADEAEVLLGLPDGAGYLKREAIQVLKNQVAPLSDDGDAEGVGAGMRVGAGEADFFEGDAGERGDCVEDARGPFGIEADGIDVDNGDRLTSVAQDEGGGVKRQIGTEAALVGLRTPSALGRARGGRNV